MEASPWSLRWVQMGVQVGVRRAWRDESGQTLVFGALCITMLVGFLGICIDIGHLRYARNRLQVAADAAALATGLEMRVCGSSNPCTAMVSAGQSALVENGFPGSTVAYNCAAVGTGSLTISFNLPPCSLGSVDPNQGKSSYLEVVLQQPVNALFARVFGRQSFTIKARAEVWHAGAPCIYALDPTGAGAITTTASLSSACGIVDESNSTNAFSCTAGTVSAPTIAIAGGSGGLLCTTNPKARTGAPLPTPADPLKYIAVPATLACGTSLASPYYGSAKPLVLAAGTYVLYPDKAYCGGITIQAAANVTFKPGTYVLTGPTTLSSGLSISLLATVSGSGVTIYNSGPNGGLSMTGTGTSNVKLSAPTSGTYSGLLYFQDLANTTAATVTASSTGTNLQGGFYLPSAKLSYAAANPGPYTLLVAKDLSFTASTLNLAGDFSSLASGSPINADNVQMVQ